jgi:hypothetical protein
MSKTKRKAAAAGARATAQTAPPDVGFEAASAAPWWIALACLALLAYMLLWWPVNRVPAHMEINYNEGWNAYNQQRAANGEALYGKAPLYFYTNYPPLSFHLIGLLGKLTGDLTLTGRWVSLVSFFAVAALLGLTVRRLTGLKRAGAYAALCFAILVAALRPDRIGMNDPHLLGMAFGALGLYWLVCDPHSARWLSLSAAAFAVSIFTKQSLVAIPAAVAIYLFLDSRSAFRIWLTAAVVTSVVLLGLTFAVDGRHFLEHMALPRSSAFALFWKHVSTYLLLSSIAIAGAVAWCYCAAAKGVARLLVWMLALTNGVALWFATGAGVDENILFDPIVAIALIAGVAAPWAIGRLAKSRMPVLLATVLLLAPFLAAAGRLVTRSYPYDLRVSAMRPQLEAEFTGLVQLVQAQNGDALCESLLVCFEAGKPEVYDPYLVTQLLSTGKVREADILRLIEDRHFSVVQTDTISGVDPLDIRGHDRFSPAFMTKLLANYQMVWRTGNFAAFVPKPR